MNGLVNYLSGLAAEECVAADYVRRGHVETARRWRGTRGEIDLVMRDGEGFVFVEVKKARNFAQAALRLSAAQLARIQAAALEFAGIAVPGQIVDMRVDLALVDGAGRVEIMENVTV